MNFWLKAFVRRHPRAPVFLHKNLLQGGRTRDPQQSIRYIKIHHYSQMLIYRVSSFKSYDNAPCVPVVRDACSATSPQTGYAAQHPIKFNYNIYSQVLAQSDLNFQQNSLDKRKFAAASHALQSSSVFRIG